MPAKQAAAFVTSLEFTEADDAHQSVPIVLSVCHRDFPHFMCGDPDSSFAQLFTGSEIPERQVAVLNDIHVVNSVIVNWVQSSLICDNVVYYWW